MTKNQTNNPSYLPAAAAGDPPTFPLFAEFEGELIRVDTAEGEAIRSYIWRNGAWTPGGNVADASFMGKPWSPDKVAAALGPEAIVSPTPAK